MKKDNFDQICKNTNSNYYELKEKYETLDSKQKKSKIHLKTRPMSTTKCLVNEMKKFSSRSNSIGIVFTKQKFTFVKLPSLSMQKSAQKVSQSLSRHSPAYLKNYYNSLRINNRQMFLTKY